MRLEDQNKGCSLEKGKRSKGMIEVGRQDEDQRSRHVGVLGMEM